MENSNKLLIKFSQYDNKYVSEVKMLKVHVKNALGLVIKRIRFTVNIYDMVDEIIDTQVINYTGFIQPFKEVTFEPIMISHGNLMGLTPIGNVSISKVEIQYKDSDDYLTLSDNDWTIEELLDPNSTLLFVGFWIIFLVVIVVALLILSR